MSVIERMLGRAVGPVQGPDRSRSAVTIAPMTKRDLKQGVLDTEAHAYPTPWSPGVFQSEIDQIKTGSRFYVTARQVSDDGPTAGHRKVSKAPIVGHAGLWFTADEAHVTNIAVHPRARRSGVATALMLHLAHEAIRRECVAWTLEVRVSSTGARELYRRFGFVPAGVRTKYYDNVEDAIVMWCHDIQGADYHARLDRLEAAR